MLSYMQSAPLADYVAMDGQAQTHQTPPQDGHHYHGPQHSPCGPPPLSREGSFADSQRRALVSTPVNAPSTAFLHQCPPDTPEKSGTRHRTNHSHTSRHRARRGVFFHQKETPGHIDGATLSEPTQNAFEGHATQSPPVGPLGASFGGRVDPNSFDGMIPQYSQRTDSTTTAIVGRRSYTDFTEVGSLGSGSFGRVALVVENSSNIHFALKVSRLPDGCAEMDLCRERHILHSIRGMPHCVRLTDAWVEGRSEKTHYILMQCCPGGSPSDRAASYRRAGRVWPEMEVLTLMGQVALALESLHAVNIVHVDVKPDNILIGAHGEYTLSDFGCAQVLDDAGRPISFRSTSAPQGHPMRTTLEKMMDGAASMSMSMCSQDEGDCRYTALDMLNEKRHYKAGDMFALGMTLYEVMSGHELPTKGSAFHQLRQRSDLSELSGLGYSPPLVTLVLSMMQSDPSFRPTAREVLQYPDLQINHHGLRLVECVRGGGGSPPLTSPDDDRLTTESYHATCAEVTAHLLQSYLKVQRQATEVESRMVRADALRASRPRAAWSEAMPEGTPSLQRGVAKLTLCSVSPSVFSLGGGGM